MERNEIKEPLPEEFTSLEKAAEFWETHSLDQYWDETKDAEIEVRMPLSRRVTVASELFEQLAIKSQQEGISVETLVNLWIAEKLRSSS